jgi:hypothetical protein
MRVEVVTIDNERDLTEAQAIVVALGQSERPEDIARLRAQALILADYEAGRWLFEPATAADIAAYLAELVH